MSRNCVILNIQTQLNIKNAQNAKWYYGLDLGIRKRTLVEINMDTYH